MKAHLNISVRASALQITVALALIAISAILLASTSKAAPTTSQPTQGCGRIDNADVMAAEFHYVDAAHLTGCPLTAADCGGNSSVNSEDVLAIQRFYLGFTSGAGRTGTDAGCGRCYGDVTSSTNAPLSGVTLTLPTANFDTSVAASTFIIQPVVITTIDASSGLVGFQGDFTFDERVVTFSATQPVLLGGLLLNSAGPWNISGNILPGAGPFRTLRVSAYAYNGTPPLSGSGTLFNLKMRRVSSTPGDMSNLVWTASPDDFQLIDTTFNAFSPQQNNGLITITSGPSPTPSPSPGPTACGRIDTPDAIAVERHFLNEVPLTGCPLTAADTVAFGSINFQDILAMQRFYLGFTGGTVGRCGTDTGCGLCYGDVNLSTTSALPGVTVSLPTATLDISVDISTVINQPVVTTNIDSNEGLVGFQGDFTFDERVVSFLSGQPAQADGLTSPDIADWQIAGHILPGTGPFRTLRVSGWALYGGFKPLAGSGTLFNLRMIRVSSTPGDICNLVWASPENFQFVHTSLNLLSPQQTNGQVIITPIPEPQSPTPPPTPAPTPPPSPTPTPTPGGSCGPIDIADACAVARHFVVSPFLTGCALTAADVTANGTVNNQDILAIPRYYLGFTSGIGSVTGTDAGCGRCYGDVVSSTNSPLPGVTVSMPTANLDTTVDISTIIIQSVVTTNIDSSMGLIGFQGDFIFDERVVTFPSQATNSAGITGGSSWLVSGHVVPGAGPFKTLRVSGFFPDGTTTLSGSGTLFNLRMQRVSSTPGDMSNLVPAASPKNFQFIHTTLDTLTPSANAGLITITGPTPAPTPTPTPTPTPPPTPAPPTVVISGRVGNCSSPAPTATPPAAPTPPTLPGVPNVLMTLTGSSSGTTLTDASGNYSFTVATGGSYTVTASKGPLPPASPGIITTDVLAIQRHYLGILTIPAGCRRMAADVLVDGVINTSDVICPQKFFQGFTANIGSCGVYKFTPASQSYPVIATNQTGQDYAMYIIGDVAPVFVNRPADGSPAALEENELVDSSVTSVNLPEIEANNSRRDFIAPVSSSLINTKENLVGFQGDFTFDERVVTFAHEPVQAAGLTANNWNVSGNILPGKGPIRTLRISAYSTDFVPLSGVGTLFDLKIARVNSSGGSSPLIWSAPPDNFIFINGDLQSQRPGNTSSGSVSATQRR